MIAYTHMFKYVLVNEKGAYFENYTFGMMHVIVNNNIWSAQKFDSKEDAENFLEDEFKSMFTAKKVRFDYKIFNV